MRSRPADTGHVVEALKKYRHYVTYKKGNMFERQDSSSMSSHSSTFGNDGPEDSFELHVEEFEVEGLPKELLERREHERKLQKYLLATSFEDTCRILDKCIERKKRHQEKQPQDDKDMDKLVRSRLVSLLNLDKLQVKSKEDNPEVCCGVRLKVKQFLDHIHGSKFIGEPYKDDLLDKLLRNLDPHAIKEVKGKQISEQCNHAETLEDIRRTEKRLLHQRNTFEDDLTLIAAYFLKR